MITITPNAPPPNLVMGGGQRFMGPGPGPGGGGGQRFPHPARQPFFQPFRAYRQGGTGPVIFDPEFDGKRLRKSAMRKTVDYNAAIIKMLEGRVWQRDFRDRRSLQPDPMYIPDLMPPSSYEDNPINAVTTRFVKTATNKMRCPIFCMAWTPEGRRLVTGASSGEFTLWNGLTFNFETILQAHDTPVRTMVWSHNEMWMVTADHAGYVKYWQSNMNNVKMFLAHQEAIRGISFSPSDSKFASCSDDGTIKIWDFYRCQEERTLRGHGADVKCVHWHPQKGLVISGSKDNQQPVKLWDPKTGNSLATIHAHKSTVMDVKWNNNGNWFVTASRDHLLKLFDLRNLNSEVQVFRGHKKESSSVAWHPIHEGLFCSGGSDGAILFWHVGAEKEVGAIEQAHDSIVWTLAWHPMGHILCSGSNDHTSKFWTRNRPGDSMRDKYNLNTLPPIPGSADEQEIEEFSVIPGMGPEDKVELSPTAGGPLGGIASGTIPGLEEMDISEDKNKPHTKKVPYSKPIPRNFQAQWNDTGKLDDQDEESSKDMIDPIALLNQLIEQQPGVKLVKELEPEALYIYGKVLPVESGSALAKAISEGGERLMRYVNSGAIKELRDVIPHYENDDGTVLPNIQSDGTDTDDDDDRDDDVGVRVDDDDHDDDDDDDRRERRDHDHDHRHNDRDDDDKSMISDDNDILDTPPPPLPKPMQGGGPPGGYGGGYNPNYGGGGYGIPPPGHHTPTPPPPPPQQQQEQDHQQSGGGGYPPRQQQLGGQGQFSQGGGRGGYYPPPPPPPPPHHSHHHYNRGGDQEPPNNGGGGDDWGDGGGLLDEMEDEPPHSQQHPHHHNLPPQHPHPPHSHPPHHPPHPHPHSHHPPHPHPHSHHQDQQQGRGGGRGGGGHYRGGGGGAPYRGGGPYMGYPPRRWGPPPPHSHRMQMRGPPPPPPMSRLPPPH